MKVLVTGAAGFIGSHVSHALLARGDEVLGVDNLNDYYTPTLKTARLARLRPQEGFLFEALDIADRDRLMEVGTGFGPDIVVHLAAQAGVRYSLSHPFSYAQANLVGQLSVLELARRCRPRHLVYASSSSVYGGNTAIPFSETDRTDDPVSLYGATKKAGEALSVSYANLYGVPQTGLRFFTVYGPWGRPDMAYWIFTEKMLAGEEIDIFNQGEMGRDFTYIDDIVDGVLSAMASPPGGEDGYHRVFNLGNDRPEELMTLVQLLEQYLGVTAQKRFLGMQKGDVTRTWADISAARQQLGYSPKTTLEEGLQKTVAWRRGPNFPL